jgi:hypothetical protein
MNFLKLRSNSKPKPHRLLLWLALTALGLVVISGWLISNSSAWTKMSGGKTSGPRLSVEKETIDHGKVKLGVPVYDSVRVTNLGDQPLRFIEEPSIEVAQGC